LKEKIRTPFANIGAVVLAPMVYPDKVWEIFNLLTLPWQYQLSLAEQKQLAQFFRHYYHPTLVTLFNRASNFNRHHPLTTAAVDESPTEKKLINFLHQLCRWKRKCFNKN
jgi:hypothetical protein